MALEDLLAANTAALEANTEVLRKLYELKVKDVAPVQKAEKADVKKLAVATQAAETKAVEKETATESPSEPADVEITLQQLVAKFTDLVDLNRDAAVALLKEFGLPKLGQAKQEQYVELYNKTCELLNG